jgi:predicted transcriptional regulator
MQSFLVSIMRFSAAVTLYGMEQVQSTLNVVDGGEDLSKSMDKLEKTLNSLTDALIDRIDDRKRETLKSVTKASEDVVSRTVDFNIMDPREVVRATNDLIQKTSDATAEWVSKATEKESDKDSKASSASA